MAPRTKAKQTAAESTVEAADGNVTPPKRSKTVAKSAVPKEPVPKQVKSAVPRRVKQAEQPTTVFSPMRLRSKNKNIASKNDTEDKTVIKKPNKEKTVVKNNAGEKVVQKKPRVADKSTTVKKTQSSDEKSAKKAETVKPKATAKAKAPVAKKQKENKVENGAGNKDNNNKKPERTTRRKIPEEVASTATKVQMVQPVKRSRKIKVIEAEVKTSAKTSDEENNTEMIAQVVQPVQPVKRSRKVKNTEAEVKTSDEENNTEMIETHKKSRQQAKKPAKTIDKPVNMNDLKEAKTSTAKNISTGTMNLTMDSLDESDSKDVSSNKSLTVSQEENNQVENASETVNIVELEKSFSNSDIESQDDNEDSISE